MTQMRAPAPRIVLIGVALRYAEAVADLAKPYGIETIRTEQDPMSPVQGGDFRLLVLQVEAEGAGVCERVRALQKIFPRTPVVVLAERLHTDHVVRLMRRGVADVVGLPASASDVASRALDSRIVEGGVKGGESLVGESGPIRQLVQEVELVAATRSTVLLTGETGTGKGLVARTIHERSDRRESPFVHIECTGLAPTLIESELFGHERGAFTGAAAQHRGRFELAGRGSIFLDEIGDLAPELQAKLLRVLHDRTFERLAGTQTLPMNARVIAATNADLRRRVGEGRFRSDLYFRLKVFHVDVPPLRERLEDVPLLVRAGLDRLANQLEVPVPPFSDGFMHRLQSYGWPGNVRELMNVLERLLVTTAGRPLEAEDLDGVLEGREAGLEGIAPRGGREVSAESSIPAFPAQGREAEDEPERRLVSAVLRDVGGNIARASRRLGIPRSTLRYRIRRLGLDHLLPRD